MSSSSLSHHHSFNRSVWHDENWLMEHGEAPTEPAVMTTPEEFTLEMRKKAGLNPAMSGLIDQDLIKRDAEEEGAAAAGTAPAQKKAKLVKGNRADNPVRRRASTKPWKFLLFPDVIVLTA